MVRICVPVDSIIKDDFDFRAYAWRGKDIHLKRAYVKNFRGSIWYVSVVRDKTSYGVGVGSVLSTISAPP